MKYEISTSPELQEMEDNISEDDMNDITDNDISENDSTQSDTTMNETFNEADQKKLDASLLKFIIKSYQQISFVEGQGFKGLMSTINDNYIMPTSDRIKETILPEMYKKCLEKQKNIVQQEAKTVCLTIDRWTSKQTYDLLAITAHFISPDYQFRSVVLKVCMYGETSEEIATTLKETCLEWDIFDKIIWCVVNDTADIVQAVNVLGWNHCTCIAYKLDHILQNSLKLCENIISKVEKIVSHFISTSAVEESLLDYQKAHGTAEPLTFDYFEFNVWDAIYIMIERFVVLADTVKALLEECDKDLPILTDTDWIRLKQLCKLLKPFYEATKDLSADKYTCASKVIVTVKRLKDILQETNINPDHYCSVKDVVETIDAELDDRFLGLVSDTNLIICTLLDPRYKTAMFLNENTAEMAKSTLVAEIIKVINDGLDNLPMEYNTNLAEKDEGEISLEQRHTSVLEKEKVMQEVELYLQEELVQGNPYEWWQRNQSKFPNLANLFKARCCMVATSVPAKQLFSEQGVYRWQNRNMLSYSKAAKYVFLSANLTDDDYVDFMP